MAAYTNFWSKHNEPSYAERKAKFDVPTHCSATTKKGNPCKGYASVEDGLCVGHRRAAE